MTVYQILQCKQIVSIVPYGVKADAVAGCLHNEVTNLIPATIMKGHDDFNLFVDEDSYAKVDESKIVKVGGKDYTIERK